MLYTFMRFHAASLALADRVASLVAVERGELDRS